MSEILFVTWDGGGNVPPAIAIGHELQARGHTVRFLGHACQEQALTEAGFEFVRPRHARDFSSGRTNSALTVMATFGDAGLGRDLIEHTASRPADLVVVDCLMFGALAAAREAGLRYAVLEHLYDGYYRRGILGGPMSLNLRLRRLRPRQALEAAAARILTTLPELDPVPGSPANLRQVGPVVAPAVPARAARPTVLISLSTYAFPRMQQSLQNLVDATRDLAARVVVTTGPVLDPADLTTGPEVEVHRYVPHAELMPDTSVFVGHGGHGSTMQALAHGLPLLLMPMDRLTDQPLVARSVEAGGAGLVAAKGARPERVAPLLSRLLTEGAHRTAAERLGAAVRAAQGAVGAADVVEELVGRRSPAGGAA